MYTLNLTDIRSEVKGKIHNTSISNTKIDRWSNITQDYIWAHADLKSAEQSATFSCVASQEIYYIDGNIGRIKQMVNTSSDWIMNEVSESEMNSIDPLRTETGNPERYSVYGKSEISAQNATASKLSIVSSSALDTTQYVRMIGKVSGVETAEDKILNGIVSGDSTATFDANGIIGIRLSATCAGNITVSAGSTTIVIIPIGKLFRMYQPIRLGPIPSGTDAIRLNYIQGPRQMISAYDIPDLPPEYHYLIPIGALAQARDEMYEFDVAEVLYAKLDKEIENLKRKDSSIRGKARTIKPAGIRNVTKYWGKYPPRVTGA